jgi:uncharacterized membrane protein YdjX (TVP38/TMEM64 family)
VVLSTALARRVALLLFAVLAVGLASAWGAGWFEGLDRERVTALIRAAGPWGPVVFVAAFALLEPFGAPGVLFAVPASWVWPLPEAFALSWLGAVGAGCVGFFFARTIGRDWVEAHLPDRFRRFDERLATRGLVTVIVVRLAFFLAPPAHWLLGLSPVRVTPFVLGTSIGFAPGIFALVLFGEGLVRAFDRAPPELLAAVVVAVLAFALWRRRRLGRNAESA